MSHDRHLDRDLDPATSEDSHINEETFSYISSTIDPDDGLPWQTHTQLPTYAYSNQFSYDFEYSFTGVEYDGSFEGIGDWQSTASQVGSSTDTTFGTHGSFCPQPYLPTSNDLVDVSQSLVVNPERGPLSSLETVDEYPISMCLDIDEDARSSASYINVDTWSSAPYMGDPGPEQMEASLPGTMPISRRNSYDSAGHLYNDTGLWLRTPKINVLQDAPPLLRWSPTDPDVSTTSIGTSSRSQNSVSVPERLDCPSCAVSFCGSYAKANLARHRRLKHGSIECHEKPEYRCQSPGCSKTYKRQDARLKHYRKCHLELAGGRVPTLRTKYRSISRISGTERDRGEDHELISTMSALLSRENESKADDTDTAPPTQKTPASEPSTKSTQQAEESLKCSDCHRTFNRLADLRRHKATLHDPDPPQYICTIPGCDRASKAFSRKDKLMVHMEKVHSPTTTLGHDKHSNVTYACPERGCAREFDQRAELLRHQRTHTDISERPHKCARCEKSFLYPKDLKRHEATHLDDQDEEKPSFHCQVASCEYRPGGLGFSRKDGMLRHMKRFHPDLTGEKEGA